MNNGNHTLPTTSKAFLDEEFFEHLKKRNKKPLVRLRRGWYRFTAFVVKIRTWPRRSFQTYRKGYNYESLWSFDLYLAKLLADAFNELADMAHGFPATLNKGDFYSPSGKESAAAFEEWKSILREISAGFKRYTQEEDYDNYQKDTDERQAAVKNSLELMTEWYPHFWD